MHTPTVMYEENYFTVTYGLLLVVGSLLHFVLGQGGPCYQVLKGLFYDLSYLLSVLFLRA